MMQYTPHRRGAVAPHVKTLFLAQFLHVSNVAQLKYFLTSAFPSSAAELREGRNKREEIHWHTAVSQEEWHTAVSQEQWHTAVSQEKWHTAVSQEEWRTAVSEEGRDTLIHSSESRKWQTPFIYKWYLNVHIYIHTHI